MTGLLDQLADVNPVPVCDPPSIDDVWHKLDALDGGLDRGAGAQPPIARPRGRALFTRGVRALPAFVAVAVCLAVVIVTVTALRSRPPVGGGPGSSLRSTPAWNASAGQSPSLSALMAHFAVLRRPPTAAERRAARRFAFGVGTRGRTEYPAFVRLAGDGNGIPVRFVVDPIYRHGASGPTVAYSMQIVADGGINYTASNYTIFPTVVGSASQEPRSEYLSVVPDGVRMVRWHFACRASAQGCILPPAGRTVSVPVRDNLAVWLLPRAHPGTFYADAVSVTWYREDGTRTTFTDQNAAVPFAGAPAWPSRRPSPPQTYAAGNGPSAGESLAHWRSLYGVLRRPQAALDRVAAAKTLTVPNAQIVSNLTRVVLSTDDALVFITLSAVNPGARAVDRRYVATFWSVSKDSGGTQSQSFAPGAQIPEDVFAGPSGSLQYSIVPDDVTRVAWQVKCSGCGRLSGSQLVLTAHHNVVYSLVKASSLSITRGTWFRRGATPLRFGP